MSNIYEELLASLRGMAGTNVGAAKADAIRGGRDALGAESIDPANVMSQETASEPLMSVAPVAPPPLTVEQPTAVEQPSKLTPSPSSAAPSSPPVKTSAPASSAAPAPTPDGGLEGLLALASKTQDRSGQRADLESKQAKALAEMAANKDLTQEEQVAVALLAIAPGLLGAIGGGIAGGGAGVMAGLGGGLSGGAQGIQSIADNKNAKRKEAKTDAEKLAERIAALDQQIAAEKDKAADKELSIRLQERAAEKAEKTSEKKMALERDLAQLSSKTQITTAAMTQKGAMDRLKQEGLQQLQLAGAKAKNAGPAELKDFQGKATQFATSMLLASKDLNELHDASIWNTMSTWGGLRSMLSDPKRQKYARAAFNFIDAVTRDVSGAAITPDEWETKFKQYLALPGSSAEDIAAAKQYRDAATETILAKAGPGREIALRSVQNVLSPSQSLSQEDQQAVEWALQNQTDPRAKTILQMHGGQ
jgi:hypothetical protein